MTMDQKIIKNILNETLRISCLKGLKKWKEKQKMENIIKMSKVLANKRAENKDEEARKAILQAQKIIKMFEEKDRQMKESA